MPIPSGTSAHELDGGDCPTHLCFCFSGSYDDFPLGTGTTMMTYDDEDGADGDDDVGDDVQ